MMETGPQGITSRQRKEIREVLDRRANEIAHFINEYRADGHPLGSVELACQREVDRLRHLADVVDPPEVE